MSVKLKFEPRDVWIGVYWTKLHGHPPARGKHTREIVTPATHQHLRIYICLLPMLPIVLDFQLGLEKAYWQEDPALDDWLPCVICGTFMYSGRHSYEDAHPYDNGHVRKDER